MLYFYPLYTPCKSPHIAQNERVIFETRRFQGNQVVNLSSRFTDIPSKRKHTHKGRCLITSIFATLFCSPALSDQALSHFIVKPPVTGVMAPAAEPSFLCTFCWKPQFRPAKPRVLGREARIACETCWRSVLNLSICWVCGEIVVRGEEVVSLGWCFWHRGCFGCLICGTSLDPPLEDKDEEGELRWIDEDDSDERSDADSGYIDRLGRGLTQRQRGVELESVPLCSWCDNATEGLYKGEILEIGLKNVTRKDGGLSKARLDMLKKTKSKDRTQLRQTARTLTKGQRQVQRSGHETEGGANLLASAADMGISEDGNVDRMSGCSNPAESTGSMPDPIYVSVLDAIGEPSFRASKTKPLPRWMTLLPSNRQQKFERDGATESSPETRMLVHAFTSNIDEEPPDSHAVLDTPATAPVPSSLEEINETLDNGPNSTIDPKMDDAATFEHAISKDSQVRLSRYHTSSEYRATRPQRAATPYSFKRAVYRPPLSLSIQRSLFPCPATTMPANGGSFSALSSQVVPPLLSGDEGLRERNASREAESIVEMFKGQKTEEDRLVGREKMESGREAYHAVQAGYIDKRDELRRELLSLFNGRRELSQE